MNSIRIHAHGTGKGTDPVAVKALKASTPNGFRKAQDVLTVTAKYIKKSGLFSSERSRLQKMQAQCYELSKALKEDGFLEHKRVQNGDAWIVIEYLSLFSDAFPNWQEEYATLNRFIPEFF